jgi:hypothetical protein
MSLNSLTNLAVERDVGEPKKRPTPKRRDETPPVAEEKHTYADALVSAIPTEVLALYTFLVTEIVGTITVGEDKRLTMRWIVYAAGILAIIVYLVVGYMRRRHATRKRAFPGAEISAATAAFSAWGLIMPGSPLVSMLSSDNARIWTGIITVTGVFLVGLLSGSLTGAAKRARSR